MSNNHRKIIKKTRRKTNYYNKGNIKANEEEIKEKNKTSNNYKEKRKYHIETEKRNKLWKKNDE